MLGETLGPYHIDAEIGSGGMGMVYAATVAGETQAAESGARVALKVVHPHLLEKPGFFKRFLREAEIGKAVRHPNVVRTLDVDAILHGGKSYHYLVMEFVEGRDLRSLLQELGKVPEGLLREIASQVAEGLAAVHAVGVVHRDMKPENVLITDDHQVRIMDLGVAQLTEVSIAITRQGEFAGSLLYASPEQFKRGEVGPPSDLYSLGVLLHELATAENPFLADSPSAVIAAHLNDPPPRVADRNSEVSLFFSEVVSTLLAKHPAERFPSATALHGVLAEAEASAWWAEREPALLVSRTIQPKIHVRRETTMHGRDEELALLTDAWAQARGAQGNTVFLEGEDGIGKTRLVDAFLQSIEGDDLHVLYGSYPPSGGMGGISDALLDHFGAAGLADALRPYLTVTPTLIPAFAALIRHEAPPTGSEPLRGDALNTVFVHLVRALAAESPLVWVVDDLHYAPADSRQGILAIARALEGHRVLLVGTTQDDLEEVTHFSRLPNFRRVPLRRLSPRQVIELLREAFQSEALAQKLGGKIAFKSDGVPFFVFEMIRGLKEGQFIAQQPDGSYVETRVIDDIDVPSAVRDLIEARLKDLSDDDRNLLDVAAIQGYEFDAGLVAHVCETKRVHVLQKLAAMERRSGLIRSGGGGYRFDHHQIREVLYKQVPPELAAEYHTMIAEGRAERPDVAGKDPEDVHGDVAVFVTDHGLRGSRPELGLPYLVPALEHLAGIFSNDAVITLIDRALAVDGLVTAAERVDLLIRKAARLGHLGDSEAQVPALEEARILEESTGNPTGKVKHALGVHLAEVARYDEAIEMFRRAQVEAEASGDRKLLARISNALGAPLWRSGRTEEALAAHERASRLFEECADAAGVGRATGNMGAIHYQTGRLDESRACLERNREIAREEGDRGAEAVAIGNLGVVLRAQGRLEESRMHYQQSLDLAREIGFRRVEAVSTGNLGSTYLAEGRLDASRRQLVRNLEMVREMGNPQAESIVLSNLGSEYLTAGGLATGLAHIDAAIDLAREIGAKRELAIALAHRGSYEARWGDPETARQLLRDALATAREIREATITATGLLALGALARDRGDLDAAKEHFSEVLESAQDSGMPALVMIARARLAELPGGDVQAALDGLGEHEAHLDWADAMDVRFLLFRATGDVTHLAEAHRRLLFLRDHAGAELETTILDEVPLHRDILAAWAEHRPGARPGSDPDAPARGDG